jgi:hypothetical protein
MFRLRSRRATVGAALALLAGIQAGCGITHTPLEVALGDGSSATASAALAIRGLDDGDLTTAVAQTAVDDAVRVISTAASDSAEYEAAIGPERRLQQRAVGLIARAVRHLHDAQDRLTDPAQRARLEQTLKRDHDQLDELATRAGEVG